jgi:(E)-4-hydroxy-3-methylbut-2-enyl-diphosphate synthase
MRIGTNHGSLSDRIMSRYGDTPMGMVESAMEFLRVARANDYHNIVLSMKASNPQVMVQAYRLLIQQMQLEFNECYPLHLGVTEAGDGEDGRVKSAAGIGTLLEDGIGDTVRVSLTEDPEFEIPVCRDLVKRYTHPTNSDINNTIAGVIPPVQKLSYDPFVYKRRSSVAVSNVGASQVPVVIAEFSKIEKIEPSHLTSIGYTYDAVTDKWNIGDQAADYIFTGHQLIDFELPGTLKVIVYPATWAAQSSSDKYIPIFDIAGYDSETRKHPKQNFVMMDCFSDETPINDFTHLDAVANDPTVILCLSSKHKNAMPAMRRMFMALQEKQINNPVVITIDSDWNTTDEHLIHFATEAGALLLDGFGDGLCFGLTSKSYDAQTANASKDTSGRNYNSNASVEAFINATAFTILQATRTRISKTEYISCPSCGRTLFNLQETTAKIRSVTNHLKGVKIAIMGCIVNGPGEMADADFGYVGSGPGKITLYKGKEVVKKNVDSEIAVYELIHLLKEHDAWVDPA